MAQVEQATERKAYAAMRTGFNALLLEVEPSIVNDLLQRFEEYVVAAHAPSVAPPPRGEKRPIARPCSACGDGDTEMKYHDHFPPFADEPGTPSVAEAPAPDEDELYSRHMAELEANWHVHPIPPEDREWINGYKQGWLRHRMRSAPALSESAKEFLSMAREGVANSGRIAGVSDRIDLKVNAQPLQGSSEAVKLETVNNNPSGRT